MQFPDADAIVTGVGPVIAKSEPLEDMLEQFIF